MSAKAVILETWIMVQNDLPKVNTAINSFYLYYLNVANIDGKQEGILGDKVAE